MGIEPSDSIGAQSTDKSAVKQVAEANMPLELGSIAVGEDGHIQQGVDDRPLHFRFSACGVDFEADMASKAAPLRLRANLGKLPYSAETPDGRRLARMVMAATDRLCRGQILLSANQDMLLEGEMNPLSPRTPVHVIAAAVTLILDFKPYLDLLAEAVSTRPSKTLPSNDDAVAPAET